MKGLLIKDFKLLAGQKRFFIVVLTFGLFFMISNSEPVSGVGYITMLFTIFTLSTISYDEYDNGMAFLMTLPIGRKTYVAEKYVFAGTISVVSAVASSVLAVLAGRWMEVSLDMKELLGTGVIMILFSWLILAVAIPMQIKFGAEKGRNAMMLTGGAIFAVLLLLAKGSEYFGIDLSPIAAGMVALDARVLAVATVFAVLILIIMSYLIGVNIIKKKEY